MMPLITTGNQPPTSTMGRMMKEAESPAVVNTKADDATACTNTDADSQSGMDVGFVEPSTRKTSGGKHRQSRRWYLVVFLLLVAAAVMAIRVQRRTSQGNIRGKSYDKNNQDIYIDDADLSRTRWPELVGYLGYVAKESLEAKYGDMYNVYLVEYGSGVTKDYRRNRVRIYMDTDERVSQTPAIG